MTATQGGDEGFVAFFRRYVNSWYHPVATVVVTLFGILGFIHNRLFAVLAVAAYVLPPVVLYLTDSLPADGGTDAERDAVAADGDRRSPRGVRAGESDTADPAPARGASPATGSGAGPESEPGTAGEASEDSEGTEPEWRVADVPTDEALSDVVVTDAGAYAVGDEGCVLAGGPDGWSVAVPDGPGAGSNALSGVDATDDGVWFAGGNGALGRLDADSGRHVDHSAPDGDTTNVADVAAASGPDGETVLLVDGSGRVRRGRYRDGETTWSDPVTPGSGSSMSGVALADESTGYLCDTNQSVFELADRGTSFERVGVDSVDGTLTDVAATGSDACLASADDGVVHRYDGARWTPHSLGDDPLWALAADGDRRLACADGGTVYERSDDAGDWERVATPVAATLRGVALDGATAVAVGDDGAVVERSPAPRADR